MFSCFALFSILILTLRVFSVSRTFEPAAVGVNEEELRDWVAFCTKRVARNGGTGEHPRYRRDFRS
jgi:hypothetical protein